MSSKPESTLNNNVVILHRYFLYTSQMRHDYFTELSKLKPLNTIINFDSTTESRIYQHLWYGTLYVVIEGWEHLGLTDSGVDNYLQQKDFKNNLRLFRNATFHLQKDEYFSGKHLPFLSDKEAATWVIELHELFSGWFLNWLDEMKQQD